MRQHYCVLNGHDCRMCVHVCACVCNPNCRYNEAQFSHFVIVHAKVGLVITIFAAFQPLNAFMRPGVIKPETDAHEAYKRHVWELVHKGLGYAVLLLAW